MYALRDWVSNRGYACDLAEVGQGLCDCHHRAPNQFIIAVIVGVFCMHCHPDAFVGGGIHNFDHDFVCAGAICTLMAALVTVEQQSGNAATMGLLLSYALQVCTPDSAMLTQ